MRGTRNEKEFYTSLWVTELEQIDSRQPVLSILASISMLLRPVKAGDDGSGREVALWAKLELDIAEMQSVASRFDSLQVKGLGVVAGVGVGVEVGVEEVRVGATQGFNPRLADATGTNLLHV